MFRATIKELANSLDIEYPQASALTKFLVLKGEAKDTGKKIKTSTGKGRASSVFEYPEEATVKLK